jgi:PAS domain S-box-containing protein
MSEPEHNPYRHFFELSLSLLCTAEAGANTFSELNPAWEDVLGWTLDELRSRPFTEFIHPDDLAPTFAIIEDMVARGLPAVNFENRYRHKDGRWVWLSWVGAVRDGTFYSAARDISEEKAAREELERANTELSEFAYAASHDLQEPLRAITAHLGFLNPAGLDERSLRSMKHVLEGATHMQALVEGLLEWSRIGSQAGDRTPEPLGELVGMAARLLAAEIGAAGADVTIRGDLPILLVDRTQFVRVFQNVLANAIKFRAPDRRCEIVVSAERDGHDWVISVADNGVGIDPDRAERAFQIFQRLHARSKYPGMGVGLALVKRIVKRHGGDVWLEGRPGEGATVSFRLPLPPATEEAP